MIPFVKMHGCGNDFIVIREAELRTAVAVPAGSGSIETPPWRLDPAHFAARVCDRHFGIGGDGLLVYGPRAARDGVPRVRMFYWNADGSRAEMCGNGARCVVRLAWERGETGAACVLETDAGDRPAIVRPLAGRPPSIEIDMGPALWEPERVPVRGPGPAVLVPLQVAGRTLQVTAVSMGNPHAVVFVPGRSALAEVPLPILGAALSHHEAFPHGANASFVAVDADGLHLRTWERGAGATLACGTATCAATAAARRAGYLAASRTRVHQAGGAVEVWEAADGHLWMAGPASTVAAGEISDEWQTER